MRDAKHYLEILLYRVNLVRDRQRAFFNSKNDTNLNLAKKAERELDEYTETLRKLGFNNIQPVEPAKQASLL